MRISDWSSGVCSSDLGLAGDCRGPPTKQRDRRLICDENILEGESDRKWLDQVFARLHSIWADYSRRLAVVLARQCEIARPFSIGCLIARYATQASCPDGNARR